MVMMTWDDTSKLSQFGGVVSKNFTKRRLGDKYDV